MATKIRGSRVFITGAGSGIGYQTALVFANSGADIIATDVSLAGLEKLQPEIEEMGAKCHCHVLDVTEEADYQALAQTLDTSGLLPDIVVNNAGLGIISPFLDTSTADWRLTLDINVMGVALGCRLFSAIWKERGLPGHLVNVSSMAAFAPPANLSAYVASKYAVEGLSEVLAMELEACNISVSCVHPGVINTPIVQDSARSKIPPAQLERLQQHYIEEGVHPRVVAEDILRGVSEGCGTILTGKEVGKIALLKRLLPRKLYRKVLISASRKIGYLPEK